MPEEVILVNDKDEVFGHMEKMEAHRHAILHRAFSIFIFNTKGEMLLQKRASGKYHSGGLWTNACCSHPRPGEQTSDAALRRLKEEMGFQVPLKKVFDFIYKAEFDNGLHEFEFDHVFTGNYDGIINPDSEEVEDFCFKKINEISESLLSHPQKYTAWFHIAFPKMQHWLAEINSINTFAK
jgi:isopentenyl-diphosphate delta-isomerase